MQYRDSRQDVTGLVVNRKVNVSIDYRRMVRALTHHLLTEGEFCFVRSVMNVSGEKDVTKTSGTTAQLHGMLAYIDQIDLYNFHQSEKGLDESAKAAEKYNLSRKESIYRRFLLFTQFYAAPRPVVICEGATDNVYLVHAVRRLVAHLPTLATKLPNGEIAVHVRFYRFFKRRKKKTTSEYARDISSTSRILQLRGGNGELLNFARQYEDNVRKFKAPGAFQPVILLVDNDVGSNDLFAYIKNTKKIPDSRKQPFIHLIRNLYVVPIPLTPEKPSEIAIEDLFPEDIKKSPVDGLPFNPNKQHQDHASYGKAIFAHKVVRPNAETIDFSGFRQLLSNISAVIEEHRKTHPAPGKIV